MKVVADEEFVSKNFTVQPFDKAEYENCVFTACSFAGISLKQVIFIDCEFHECDFSGTDINQTAFRNTFFSKCKMLGLHFEYCNAFLLECHFKSSQLDLSSFYGLKLVGFSFGDCSLKEADFSEADCTGVAFDNCDLEGAIFDRTICSKADFRSAHNFIINPKTNSIDKAKFSLQGLPGLLTEYNLSIEH